MKLLILCLLLCPPFSYASKSGAADSPFDTVELPFNPAAEQKNCGATDLRNETAWSALPDRRHQDSSGWCYAYVLADIYSYENGVNLSPADIAFAYIRNDPQKQRELTDPNIPLHSAFPLGGGFYEQAMQAVQGRGICREEDFPSEDHAYSLIEEARRAAASLAKSERRPMPEEELICIEPNLLNVHLNLSNIERVLAAVKDNEFRNLIAKLSTLQCTPDPTLRLGGHFVMRDGPGSNPLLNRSMDEVIDARKPAAISMDSGILARSFRRGQLNSHPSTNHAVSIVGRRFNETSGRCEYLLRNSDNSCTSYLEAFRENCENNHVWVPRELVRYGTRDVYSAR